jgi:hypothetical protein
MPDGTMAPVAAPPLQLGSQELVRRDVELLTSNTETTRATLQADSGLGKWWRDLPALGKTWTIVGIVGAGMLIYQAVDDESPASPS